MLIHRLRQLETDGVVERIVYAEVLPKVEYRLTAWEQALSPALDAILTWTSRGPHGTRGKVDSDMRRRRPGQRPHRERADAGVFGRARRSRRRRPL